MSALVAAWALLMKALAAAAAIDELISLLRRAAQLIAELRATVAAPA